jgi:transcriptional regulator with XRE-family HTH domain
LVRLGRACRWRGDDPTTHSHQFPRSGIHLRLGLILRNARRERCLTLVDVERRTSARIKSRTLSEYERGAKALPEVVLAEVCEVYEVDPAEVLIKAQGEPTDAVE